MSPQSSLFTFSPDHTPANAHHHLQAHAHNDVVVLCLSNLNAGSSKFREGFKFNPLVAQISRFSILKPALPSAKRNSSRTLFHVLSALKLTCIAAVNTQTYSTRQLWASTRSLSCLTIPSPSSFFQTFLKHSGPQMLPVICNSRQKAGEINTCGHPAGVTFWVQVSRSTPDDAEL